MLYTKDIGATAGSLINKAMKNKMIANKKIMEVKKNNDMDLYYNNHLNFRSVGQDVIRNRNGLY